MQSCEQYQINNKWLETEPVLIRIKNSAYATHMLYEKHYLSIRDSLKYYDVPIIVISTLNGIFIAGAKEYIDAGIVNVLTCLMSLMVGMIQSLKTFFKVDERRENALSTHKDMFKLYCDLSRTIDIGASNRNINPERYLEDVFQEYMRINDKAIVIKNKRNPIYLDTHPFTFESISTRS